MWKYYVRNKIVIYNLSFYNYGGYLVCLFIVSIIEFCMSSVDMSYCEYSQMGCFTGETSVLDINTLKPNDTDNQQASF